LPLRKSQVIPNILHRESSLSVSLTKVGIDEWSVGELLDAGFRPCRRGPLVSAKGPKTISACARPQGGLSASALNKMAQELAALSQPSPKKPIQGEGGAAPNAG